MSPELTGVFALIGLVVVGLLAAGVCVGLLLAGAIVVERLTGVPAHERRLPLESREEHAHRLAPAYTPSQEDWLLVGELLAEQDARLERAADIARLDDYRGRRGGSVGAA